MTALSSYLLKRFYASSDHPYRRFESSITSYLSRPDAVVLDAGCGRRAPVLANLRTLVGGGVRLIGVEAIRFDCAPLGVDAINADLACLPLANGCVDLIISRSVFEHLTRPSAVYSELSRVLRPGGAALILTANRWDYASLIARMVPNRWHARIVRLVEGRAEADTFPTTYLSNTRQDIAALCAESGLVLTRFEFMTQYPNYLMFNGLLFAVGMCFEKMLARFESLASLRGWILFAVIKPLSPGHGSIH